MASWEVGHAGQRAAHHCGCPPAGSPARVWLGTALSALACACWPTGSYVGCYTEPVCSEVEPRVFGFVGADANMTVEKCVAMVGALGYTFAAVQWYDQCYAGGCCTGLRPRRMRLWP
jgi:hypothetical protein